MFQVSTIHFHASQQEQFNYRKKITKKKQINRDLR